MRGDAAVYKTPPPKEFFQVSLSLFLWVMGPGQNSLTSCVGNVLFSSLLLTVLSFLNVEVTDLLYSYTNSLFIRTFWFCFLAININPVRLKSFGFL